MRCSIQNVPSPQREPRATCSCPNILDWIFGDMNECPMVWPRPLLDNNHSTYRVNNTVQVRFRHHGTHEQRHFYGAQGGQGRSRAGVVKQMAQAGHMSLEQHKSITYTSVRRSTFSPCGIRFLSMCDPLSLHACSVVFGSGSGDRPGVLWRGMASLEGLVIGECKVSCAQHTMRCWRYEHVQ